MDDQNGRDYQHPTRVLIIDDDPDFCDLVGKILRMENMEIRAAFSGDEGIETLYHLKPDLVLLDIMMPGSDGWEVTHRIRQLTDVPIIILSALSQTKDIVRSLEAGADDFVTKPFDKVELLVRIQALLNRSRLYGGPPVYAHDYDDGYLSVHIPSREVFVKGERLYLSRTEYNLFEYIFLNAGQVCTTAEILENVWGSVVPNGNKYLHVYIWKLRHKIELEPSRPTYILTEHGVGYRFERKAQVEKKHPLEARSRL